MKLVRAYSTILLLWNQGNSVLGFSFEGMGIRSERAYWRFGPFFYVGG